MRGIEQKLADDGVVILHGITPKWRIADVRREYETLEAKLTRQDIAKDQPIIVFWKHVEGETKRIAHFNEMPSLWALITENIVPSLRYMFASRVKQLQLLETIIFDKPPHVSNTLHWHQDVAYFPLKPNNQLAVWIPLEPVSEESGAMVYALGSHKEGIKGSTNLHTREKFANEDRELIPDDPAAKYPTVCFEMHPTDMLVHDGYTWHKSGPNKSQGPRRGLSVRFVVEPAVFDPRSGSGAAFTKQMNFAAGELVTGAPFPVLM